MTILQQFQDVILKFHNNIIVNVNCDRDFVVKYPLPAQGFEPMTSRLMSSCYGITLVERFCISPIYHFDPIGWGNLGDLLEVTKATAAVTDNNNPEPVLTIEWVSNCFTNSPELPCSTSSTIVLNASSYKSRSRHLRAKGAQRKLGSKKRGLVSEECRKKT